MNTRRKTVQQKEEVKYTVHQDGTRGRGNSSGDELVQQITCSAW